MHKSSVLIKPHHFLDIIKLYGAGLEIFVPDPKYGHDFYKIGNQIINNRQCLITLTKTGDDICNPCKFNKGGKCISIIENFELSSKENWNYIIDNRILRLLQLHEGQSLSACEFAIISKSKISAKEISEIWKERPIEETIRRSELLLHGLDKYINKFSS